VVVIGDPKQLRHISSLRKQQDQQLLSKGGLLEEHPGWAYSTRSLFDLASSLCRSEDIVDLRDHHRSHADIIGFSNEHFYEGRLRIATRYDGLRFLRSDEPVVRWVNVEGHVVRPGNGSAINELEARTVVQELQRLVDQGYHGSIGAVTPFRAQANRIRELIHQHPGLSGRVAEYDLLVDVVHKFQGDERDVMIFSPVVARGLTDGAIRFLRENPNLFNVAVTRARAALVVVGDRAAALNSGVDYLMKFAEYTGKLDRNKQPVRDKAVIECGPGYPPVSNPEQVSEWERVFYRQLHRAGLRPIPQYSVEKYLLDLALVDGERRLDIEIDGERYHREWNGELCRRDQIRNQRLMELGWDVMRFWVYQIRDDPGGCQARVRQWLNQQ
jgi:very-short-patch-repair endonuclease